MSWRLEATPSAAVYACIRGHFESWSANGIRWSPDSDDWAICVDLLFQRLQELENGSEFVFSCRHRSDFLEWLQQHFRREVGLARPAKLVKSNGREFFVNQKALST